MYYFVLIPFNKVFSMSAYKATPPVQNDFSEKVWKAKLGQNDRQRSRLKLMLYLFPFIPVSFVVFYCTLVFIRRKFCDFNFSYTFTTLMQRFCFRNQKNSKLFLENSSNIFVCNNWKFKRTHKFGDKSLLRRPCRNGRIRRKVCTQLFGIFPRVVDLITKFDYPLTTILHHLTYQVFLMPKIYCWIY